MDAINYTLRLCNWQKGKNHSSEYPIILETTDKAIIDKYLADNYPNRKELVAFSKIRQIVFTDKMPYLNLITTPLHKHSYITEYSIS